jgi:opacity protein-like surface antigen
MKKFLMIVFVAVTTLSVLNAQFTKIGGGLAGSTGIAWNNEMDIKSHRTSNPAIVLKGIYEISVPVHIQPSFTWFMPRVTKDSFSTYSNKQVVSAMMFDIDGHYVINSLDKVEFYGLAGLNITFLGMKWVSDMDGQTSKSKETDNAFGLNIGAGSYFKLTEQFDICAEAKYILSKYNQLVLSAGILINLDWLIKHENTGM